MLGGLHESSLRRVVPRASMMDFFQHNTPIPFIRCNYSLLGERPLLAVTSTIARRRTAGSSAARRQLTGSLEDDNLRRPAMQKRHGRALGVGCRIGAGRGRSALCLHQRAQFVVAQRPRRPTLPNRQPPQHFVGGCSWAYRILSALACGACRHGRKGCDRHAARDAAVPAPATCRASA